METTAQLTKKCPVCNKNLFYTVKVKDLNKVVHTGVSMIKAHDWVDQQKLREVDITDEDFCTNCYYEHIFRKIKYTSTKLYDRR